MKPKMNKLQALFEYIDPDTTDELERKFLKFFRGERQSEAEEIVDDILKKSAELFCMANTRYERINALAVCAGTNISIDRFKEFIPNLSAYMFTQARRYSLGMTKFMERPKFTKEKCNREAVSYFVRFITRQDHFWIMKLYIDY